MSHLSERRRQCPGPAEVVWEHSVTRCVVTADHDCPAAGRLEPEDLFSHRGAELTVLPPAAGKDQRLYALRAEVADVGELALWVTKRVAKHHEAVAGVGSAAGHARQQHDRAWQ